MRKTVEILGIPVDSIKMSEAVKKVGSYIEIGGIHTILTPNSEIMMVAQRDSELRDILVNADMLTADGAGVVLASKLLGRSLPEKVSGFDLVREIFKVYARNNLRCFLLGSKPGVAALAASKITNDYPGIVVTGFHDGYFSHVQNEDIIDAINATESELLLVALGAPKQEKWIFKYKDRLNVNICIGVGGTIDVFAGKVKLAPDFFRRNGLEWLYRLCKEPSRAVRMMDLPRFITKVLWARLKGR